jgi:hypothetical protein
LSGRRPSIAFADALCGAALSDATKSNRYTSLRARAAREPEGGEEKLPLRAAALSTDAGRVHATTQTREREALADEDLARERIDIEKSPVKNAARIVEEVSLERIGREHVETNSEQVRRQQVEVAPVEPDGKPIPSPQQQPKASR